MKNKDEILRKFNEAIQYFINCSENLPGTEFCSNVDKLIDIKCDIANGDEKSDSNCNLQNVMPSRLKYIDWAIPEKNVGITKDTLKEYGINADNIATIETLANKKQFRIFYWA